MATLTKLVIGVILSFLLYSCNIVGVQGNGNVTTETRTVDSNFSGVSATSGLEVFLKKGDEPKIVVEADSNLHDEILTYVDSGVLKIKTRDNIGRAEKKKITVTYTALNTIITTSGASLSTRETVSSENLRLVVTSGGNAKLDINCKDLDISATSAGNLSLTGKAVSMDTKCTTGATISAENVMTKNVIAKATTGGNVHVYAKESFTGGATTGGNIIYDGDPEKVSKSKTTTGGNISKG